MNEYIVIDEKDNVGVALKDISKTEPIPKGHKFALKDISQGSPVIKYGEPIGVATEFIPEGSWVHTHNVMTLLNDDSSFTEAVSFADSEETRARGAQISDSAEEDWFFEGYERDDGRIGIRNEIWIIPTVGCITETAKIIETQARSSFGSLLNEKGIDGIFSFSHPYGCSQLGDDQENTKKILASLCIHPNACGVLLLGLGCENSGINDVLSIIPDNLKGHISTLVCQDVDDEIESSLLLIEDMVKGFSNSFRIKLPISNLVIGVKCGGSDGLSGITANPMVGRFSDVLIKCGGSVLISEIPEFFGAEHLVLGRALDNSVREKMVYAFKYYIDYYVSHDLPIYENPSPGNKKGGITTLEDKSLGCIRKAGTSSFADVLEYGAPRKKSGLSLVSSPGNDLVSTTALAAAGAHLILFTTGRGTPYGSPVPTLKISTNSELYNRKPEWIDFDAGRIITEDADSADAEGDDNAGGNANVGTADVGSIADTVSGEDIASGAGAISDSNIVDAVDRDFLNKVLACASGERTASEKAGYKSMAILKTGVTL